MLRQRKQASHHSQHGGPDQAPETPETRPNPAPDVDTMTWVTQNRWVVLAIASGACAAFNGVFAKLSVLGIKSH